MSTANKTAVLTRTKVDTVRQNGAPGPNDIDALDAHEREALALRDELAIVNSKLAASDYNTEQELGFRVLGVNRAEMDTGASPWLMFNEAIRQQYGGNNAWRGFQVAPWGMDANWNHPTYGKYRQFRVLSDSTPVWGLTIAPRQAVSLKLTMPLLRTSNCRFPMKRMRKRRRKLAKRMMMRSRN